MVYCFCSAEPELALNVLLVAASPSRSRTILMAGQMHNKERASPQEAFHVQNSLSLSSHRRTSRKWSVARIVAIPLDRVEWAKQLVHGLLGNKYTTGDPLKPGFGLSRILDAICNPGTERDPPIKTVSPANGRRKSRNSVNLSCVV